jgi:hypothetical protein
MSQPIHYQEKLEEHDSIWLLTISPIVWSLHLLASYITAAVYCAKYADGDIRFQTIRMVVGGFTMLALGIIVAVGYVGYRRHGLRPASTSLAFDTPTTRHRFLGFATLLLSLLSGVATLFSAMVFVFIRNCD